MPLVVTPEDGTGLDAANSFQSVANITTRLEGVLFAAAWTAADSTLKNVCAVEATAVFGRLDWKGVRVSETQGTAFPRTGIITPDGFTLPDDELPAWLLDAHARQALHLSALTTTPYTDTGLEPKTPVSVSVITLTPASGPSIFAQEVRTILSPYLRSGQGQMQIARC